MNHYEQGSQEWLKARAGRFTSSEIYRLVTQPRTKAQREAGELSEGAKTYCFEKACAVAFDWQKPFEGNYATEHGNDWEPIAIDYYDKHMALFPVERTGFIPHGDISGGSPDAIEGGDTIIEIKCPANEMNFFKFVADGEYPEQYYWQVQDLMRITGCTSARLVYFNPNMVEKGYKPAYAIEIKRNEEDIARIEERLEKAVAYRDKLIFDLQNKLTLNL
jgi:hypothetical protein